MLSISQSTSSEPHKGLCYSDSALATLLHAMGDEAGVLASSVEYISIVKSSYEKGAIDSLPQSIQKHLATFAALWHHVILGQKWS